MPPARQAPTSVRALGEAAGASIGAVLAAVAGLRGGKAVHPHGAVHEAELSVEGSPAAPRGSELLSTRAKHRALVRFSRSVGVPRPIPDLLGMSLRVLDAYGRGRHQDFMLVTSVDLPIAHHVFVPATDVQQRPYTSSLPYRAAGERFLIGALPDPRSPRPDGDTELDRLGKAAVTGQLRFHLAVAPVMGRFTPVGEIAVGPRLPGELDALRFNPWNTGGGLEPAGVLNGARDRAYKLSQAAWRRRVEPGLQSAADERVEELARR